MPSYLGTLPQYDLMRKRVASQTNGADSGEQDALQRRYAAAGMINSGSYAKQQQLQEEAALNRRQEALGQVDMAEAQERSRLGEAEDQRSFQSNEAQKNRDFQGKQFDQEFGFKRESFDKQFDFDKSYKMQALDLEHQKLDEERRTNSFSMQLAKYQQYHSGGLFGAGGFLGTGIGAHGGEF